MRPARIPCAVPYCRRTMDGTKTIYGEHLCQRHWSLVPKVMRRVLSRIHARARRYGLTPTIVRAENRVWQRLKREAINRAVGV